MAQPQHRGRGDAEKYNRHSAENPEIGGAACPTMIQRLYFSVHCWRRVTLCLPTAESQGRRHLEVTTLGWGLQEQGDLRWVQYTALAGTGLLTVPNKVRVK